MGHCTQDISLALPISFLWPYAMKTYWVYSNPNAKKHLVYSVPVNYPPNHYTHVIDISEHTDQDFSSSKLSVNLASFQPTWATHSSTSIHSDAFLASLPGGSLWFFLWGYLTYNFIDTEVPISDTSILGFPVSFA